MNNFDYNKYLKNNILLKEEDILEPNEIDTPVDVSIDDDIQPDDLPIEDNFEGKSYIMKIDGKDYSYYLPFRSSQAEKAGLGSLKASIDNILYNMDTGVDMEDNEYADFPYWTENFAKVEVDVDNPKLEGLKFELDWVKEIDDAPTEGAGVVNWKKHVVDSFKKYKESDPWDLEYYQQGKI